MAETTTDTVSADPPVDVPQPAVRAVTAITLVTGAVQLAAAIAGRGYWFDEVYMLAIGRRHLDWGSADQPPLAPALAALSDLIAPNSIVALRIPAILATMAAIVVAALIAREMGCDRRAQALVAFAQATGAWVSFAGHWLTPYTLEPLGWLLLVWLVVRWLRLRDDRLLLALGAVAGLAAMTKFQVLLLCGVMLLAALAVGPRALLRRPLLWAGVGVGAAITAPTLWWQARHGWPQLKMAEVVASESGPLYGGRGGSAVQLIVFAGVIGAALALYGLVRLVRDRTLADYRFLGVTFVVLYVLFVATAARPYYLCGLFPPLAAVGALSLQRRREAGHSRWRLVAWPACVLSAALAAAAIALSITIGREGTDEQIAQRTAAAYARLPAGQREHTAIVGESYIVAAFLDGYSDKYQLPAAFSPTRSYGYFPAPAPDVDTVLFIGEEPVRLRPFFTHVRNVGGITDDLSAWLLTGRAEPWDSLWPKIRTLSVG